jgi:hypothetical protein
VSAYAYDLPPAAGRAPGLGHRVYLFGDEHFSYDNMCPRCDADAGCADIVGIIDREVAAAVARGRSLDVFMEFPYLRGEHRDTQLRAWDARFRAEASPVHAVKSLLGLPTRVYGVFSLLYRKYGARFYDHDAGAGASPATGAPAVRFHYADARHEPNAAAMFRGFCQPPSPSCNAAWILALPRRCRAALLAFLTHVGSAARVRDLLRAFLFGTDFVADMSRLFGADFRVVRGTLAAPPGAPEGAPRTMHRIARQFHKLAPAARAPVRAFLDRRIDELCALLADDLDYDGCASIVCAILTGRPAGVAAGRSAATPDLESFALPCRVRRAQEFVHALLGDRGRLGRDGVLLLLLPALLMDAYLLCRMMRYATQQAAAGGTTIAYTGNAHSMLYARFFEEQLGLRAVVCHPARRARRCLVVPSTPGTCPAPVRRPSKAAAARPSSKGRKKP